MSQIINRPACSGFADYLVSEYSRLFPGSDDYIIVVRNAINARLARFQALFDFYDEHQSSEKINEICQRTFRDLLTNEFAKINGTAGFMFRNYVRMNRQKTNEMVQRFMESDMVKELTSRYLFTVDVLAELSNPEWLSSRLDL